MEKVINIVTLLLVVLTCQCQCNPNPQSYSAKSSSRNDLHTQENTSTRRSATKGSLGLSVMDWGNSNSSGSNNQVQTERNRDQTESGVSPTTRRESTSRKPGKNNGPMQSPSGPEVEVTEYLGSYCVPNNGQIKYNAPGSKQLGSDYSKTFCCPEHFSSMGRRDDGNMSNPRLINNYLRQFALDLLIKLVEAEPEQNVVISPFSVWNVMLMMLEGTGGYETPTETEIRKALYLQEMSKASIQANYRILECSLRNSSQFATYIGANALFEDGNQPANPNYVATVENKYQADVIKLNFSNKHESVREINGWVANKTRNRIKKLVKYGDLNDHNLVLTNAVLFKGSWSYPFNKTATVKAPFYNERKKVVSSVDMMYQHGEYLYSFIQEINAHVLDIPYTDSHFRMLVVLPQYNSSLIDSLKAMKQFPVDACYERLVREQEMYSDAEVHVYLPRFKIRNDLTLKETLKSLGIKTVFTEQADLSKISPNNVYLSKVVHVAEIEVNEEGTVASAATGGLFGNKSKPPSFVANRPFAYFIVENRQKTVIFTGKVYNPHKG